MKLKKVLGIFALLFLQSSIKADWFKVKIFNRSSYPLTVRPVTEASRCHSYDPSPVIKARDGYWDFEEQCPTHLDLDGSWEGNKAWMNSVKNKNRDWGYSYGRIVGGGPTSLSGDHEVSVTFIDSDNGPKPYFANSDGTPKNNQPLGWD